MTTISLFVSFVLTICCCLSCIKTHVVNDICNIAYESDGNTYINVQETASVVIYLPLRLISLCSIL